MTSRAARRRVRPGTATRSPAVGAGATQPRFLDLRTALPSLTRINVGSAGHQPLRASRRTSAAGPTPGGSVASTPPARRPTGLRPPPLRWRSRPLSGHRSSPPATSRAVAALKSDQVALERGPPRDGSASTCALAKLTSAALSDPACSASSRSRSPSSRAAPPEKDRESVQAAQFGKSIVPGLGPHRVIGEVVPGQVELASDEIHDGRRHELARSQQTAPVAEHAQLQRPRANRADHAVTERRAPVDSEADSPTAAAVGRAGPRAQGAALRRGRGRRDAL